MSNAFSQSQATNKISQSQATNKQEVTKPKVEVTKPKVEVTKPKVEKVISHKSESILSEKNKMEEELPEDISIVSRFSAMDIEDS